MDRPLVFYSLVNFLGCLAYSLFIENVYCGAVITAFFFILLIFNKEASKLVLVFFFIIGVFSVSLYFNPKTEDCFDLRVVEKKGSSYVCTYLNRNVILEKSYIQLEKGMPIIVLGNYIDERDLSKGIIGRIDAKEIQLKEKDMIYKFYSVREKIFNKYIESYGKVSGGVVLAVCFGEDQYLSYDTKDKVKAMGISHILCVSGLHMVLIYSFLEKFIGIYAIIPSLLYLVFIGGKVSALRAFIMVCTNKFSKKILKEYDSLSSLCLASIIILLIKPYEAVSVGYHLSFLACVGIIIYYNRIKRKIYYIPKNIAENISLTISAQIFTMPYLIFVFEEVSIFSLLSNIIFLPLFSVIIILGNLGVLFLKLPIVFNVITTINSIFISSFYNIEYLFVKYMPLRIQLNYFDGIVIFLVYVCYIFFNKGYKLAKYVPVFLLGQQIFLKMNF
ncbi:ComEC/Rec2 family competence protein [Clostridium sp. DL1XJH146]